jgi:hypothetical protein
MGVKLTFNPNALCRSRTEQTFNKKDPEAIAQHFYGSTKQTCSQFIMHTSSSSVESVPNIHISRSESTTKPI